MSEPNPWDKLPVEHGPELKKPHETKSQLSLFSRLKSKMLTSDNNLPELPKLARCKSSLLSKLSKEDGFEPTKASFLTSLQTLYAVDSESKENVPGIALSSELANKEETKLMRSGNRLYY